MRVRVPRVLVMNPDPVLERLSVIDLDAFQGVPGPAIEFRYLSTIFTRIELQGMRHPPAISVLFSSSVERLAVLGRFCQLSRSLLS